MARRWSSSPWSCADTGDATWLWKARFTDPAAGNFTDAVQSVLEVGHVVPMLREVLLSHATDSQTNLLARANPQLLAGQGTITVSIANTRLNDLGETALAAPALPLWLRRADRIQPAALDRVARRDQPAAAPAPRHQ